MSFYTKKDIGRVYVIKMIMPDDTVVHKIGMCHSSRATDRMMEILRSWFNSFRFVPYTELRLDMECNNPLAIEQYIHGILYSVGFTPNFKVQGSTEMFTDIDEARLLWFIKAVGKGKNTEMPKLTKEQNLTICKLLTV